MEVSVGLSSRLIGLQRRDVGYSRSCVERKRVPALSLKVRSWNGASIWQNNGYCHHQRKVSFWCCKRHRGNIFGGIREKPSNRLCAEGEFLFTVNRGCHVC